MSKNKEWEVWVEFNWGVICKTNYKTRKEARNSKANSKRIFNNSSVVKSISIYRITKLPGIGSFVDGKGGVLIYEKVE